MASSSTIHIQRVSSGDRRAIERFISFPKRLYADCHYFVPWFDRGMRQILTKRHPFFDHSEGDFFIAERNGTVVGRIAVLDPKRFNDYKEQKDCRIYFFDVIEDIDAARALLTHAEAWGRERGLRRLIGPQGFSGFTGAGILIKGFDKRATMTMMNYHYPYYHRFIEELGFSKYKDFVSAELHSESFSVPDQIISIQKKIKERGGLSTRTIRTKKELHAFAHKILDIYNSAFVTHEEFCPMTERELESTIKDLLTVTDPQLVKVIEHGEDIAGFLLTFPDVSPSLIRAKGRLTPLSLIRLLWEKRTTRRFIINGIGILPRYQSRGGTAVLYYELIKTLFDRRAESAEMTQIAETTDMMMKSIDKLGGEIYKVHRIYQKRIE